MKVVYTDRILDKKQIETIRRELDPDLICLVKNYQFRPRYEDENYCLSATNLPFSDSIELVPMVDENFEIVNYRVRIYEKEKRCQCGCTKFYREGIWHSVESCNGVVENSNIVPSRWRCKECHEWV